jgi:O-6-methylguanine DNA methyltransferase
MNLIQTRIESPVGEILLVTDSNGVVRALDFQEYEERMHRLLSQHYREWTLADGEAPPAVIDALNRYFAGDMGALDAIPTASSGSAFQEAVWAAMRKIPGGSTKTYGDIAKEIGQSAWDAPRAVGAAVGSNPIAIIGPCHRVIGKSGALTGYAGGLERKQRKLWLLYFVGAVFMAPKVAGKRAAGESAQRQLSLDVRDLIPVSP